MASFRSSGMFRGVRAEAIPEPNSDTAPVPLPLAEPELPPPEPFAPPATVPERNHIDYVTKEALEQRSSDILASCGSLFYRVN
ncbi:MAG TPA: hypothetical protein VGD78_00650, partial [Chthoniobacterales bacterium]